jgi:hypothetical protein
MSGRNRHLKSWNTDDIDVKVDMATLTEIPD